jgi:hypothetical protein
MGNWERNKHGTVADDIRASLALELQSNLCYMQDPLPNIQLKSSSDN